MANQEHILQLIKGAEAWNKWRETRRSASWDYFEADLSGANLSGQDLTKRNFRKTDLSRTNLGLADIRGADFSGAKLEQTNFSRAMMGDTTFCDTDLSTAIGLDTVKHFAPSSVSIDTLYKSSGKLPFQFLLDAGVPDSFLTYLPSLLGVGIDFYSLFISYSTQDQEFAEYLHASLRSKNVRCWFARHDIQSGKKLHEQIDEAIRVFDKLLLILSEHSMKSEWVMSEIAKARKREIRDGKQVLFPIRLCSFEELRDWECFDADTGKDSAREIREYFIPDFSNWKDHDSYKKAFDKLLKDLQGKANPASA
jgi:hypothetical protein